MERLDFHNNRGSMTILTLITALNVGLVISLLTANSGGTGLVLNDTQIYVLGGLELAGIIAVYMVSKRRNTTESI